MSRFFKEMAAFVHFTVAQRLRGLQKRTVMVFLDLLLGIDVAVLVASLGCDLRASHNLEHFVE